MGLTRNQFELLRIFADSNDASTMYDFQKDISYSFDSLESNIKILQDFGFVKDGRITQEGKNALEPYRAKRAIFMAAGMGSRMSPITINTPKPLVRVNGVRIIDHLIDACLEAGIDDIYIVRGYLREQFDQLLYKYPQIKFLDNPIYNEANNISSVLVAKDLLSNAYVFETDLLLRNYKIIQKYNYSSNFLAIKKDITEDWCFEVKDGVIVEERIGGKNCWQMVGISYWDNDDGKKIAKDIAGVYESPGGKESYWEQVPLVYCKEKYKVEVRECFDEDVVEIDTFSELQAIDKIYLI